DDLGTTFILLVIFLSLLWVIGTPGRLFIGMLALMGFAMIILVLVASYRLKRITGFLHPQANAQTAGWQTLQGQYAVGSGGWFGVGLGAGKLKWGWVPNATTDFIFAIIGEELGLVGALGLLGLFGLFAYTGMRIARRSADPFLRLLTATTTMWVIGQSFINVGYVIGLLPVTGIQLPLISAGGTSTATTLLMIGMMANAARHEPEAVAALRAGRDDRMTRLLRLPLPAPYVPTRVEALRDRLRSRPQPAKASGARAARPARPPAVDQRTSRSGGTTRLRGWGHLPRAGAHHGGGQRYTGQRHAHAGRRALEGQRYG
ncbi:MAG TPA: FtsW/RodA/SpoVE family cell cycle protein, partial [Mycobacterium sp.]|uniref:FtsW/RodA/SpoVE family cell cycle protein n=1 Tax=Mycobacterium sp. TaxID=1785 RepID=UPI002D3F1AC0